MRAKTFSPRTAPKSAPRNHVALALAARARSGAAGQHGRTTGAQRRAEHVALQKALRQGGDA